MRHRRKRESRCGSGWGAAESERSTLRPPTVRGVRCIGSWPPADALGIASCCDSARVALYRVTASAKGTAAAEPLMTPQAEKKMAMDVAHLKTLVESQAVAR